MNAPAPASLMLRRSCSNAIARMAPKRGAVGSQRQAPSTQSEGTAVAVAREDRFAQFPEVCFDLPLQRVASRAQSQRKDLPPPARAAKRVLSTSLPHRYSFDISRGSLLRVNDLYSRCADQNAKPLFFRKSNWKSSQSILSRQLHVPPLEQFHSPNRAARNTCSTATLHPPNPLPRLSSEEDRQSCDMSVTYHRA